MYECIDDVDQCGNNQYKIISQFNVTLIEILTFLAYDCDDPDYDPSISEDIFNTKKSIPDEILWSMFKTDISFRTLSKVLELAFSIFGEQNNFHISHVHLFKKYQELSEANENKYKNEIRAQTNFGTICFDHQTLKSLNGKFAKADNRLAIVWHSNGTDSLLSVDKIVDKSGMEQCNSILHKCNDYNIHQDQIIAFSCDNASTNIGVDSGACIRIERHLEKPLLRMMCRHHILEIMIKDVYHHFFTTQTPTNIFYPLLKDSWEYLRDNHFPFDPCCEDVFYEFAEEHLNQMQIDAFNELRIVALNELKLHASRRFIRNDYKEITNLARKFLGDVEANRDRTNSVEFYALQKPSLARFMGVSINGLKCYLFRAHLNWTEREEREIKKKLPWFASFIGLIYVRYWNRSNILFDAGINDLKLLRDLQSYSIFDSETAAVAIRALSRHLNYLGQELVVLAIFSMKLANDEKNEIALKLKEYLAEPIPPRDINANHIRLVDPINDWQRTRVVDLIGERSPYLFRLFNLQMAFLNVDANNWNTDKGYIDAKKTIEESLICVNDSVERAISKCKTKCKRQRCRNDISFSRNLIQSYGI